MTNTGNSTEQVVTSEDNSELATAEDNNMEQTETKKQNQLQDVKPSYKEFRGVLDEIDSNIQPGTAGNGMNSIKTATHLLNWGVGTSMTTDEIKKETVSWLSDKGNSEQVEFSNKLASVYDAYQKTIMLASTNGLNEIAFLYVIRTYEFMSNRPAKSITPPAHPIHAKASVSATSAA
jgi:hypothetical protein